MATLWDRFDSLLHDAEQLFFNFEFDKALGQWESYYQITAKVEFAGIIKEIRRLLREVDAPRIDTSEKLLTAFYKIRHRFLERQIHQYTYALFLNLLKKIYLNQFTDREKDNNLLHGVFNYFLQNYQKAGEALTSYLQQNFESVEGRIFLGHVYLELGEQRSAVALLTENLFLAADQLYEDDLYLSQFKLLFGRLYSQTSRKNAAAWLLPFEAWYRNFLVFDRDDRFYKLMVQKEQNERIIRVKYTTAERYRHFVRCLFVAEYTRLFLKEKTGVILDEETYMEQLDPALFARYRKKRKPPKTAAKPKTQ